MSDMKKTVTCKYCSAEYPEELANCPYCGNANFYGQEKIYMQRMSQIRKRLASLAYIDKKIILKEILKIAGITAAVIAVIFTIISINKNNYSKQINEMRGNIINEIQ